MLEPLQFVNKQAIEPNTPQTNYISFLWMKPFFSSFSLLTKENLHTKTPLRFSTQWWQILYVAQGRAANGALILFTKASVESVSMVLVLVSVSRFRSSINSGASNLQKIKIHCILYNSILCVCDFFFFLIWFAVRLSRSKS